MAPSLGGASSNYEAGGAGGKFRRRIFRSSTQTTPYDRPRAARRHPTWLSKLVVDPASKLLSFGARRFFASVFPPRRLSSTPSPLPPEGEQERRNRLIDTALDAKIDAGVQEPVANVCDTSASNKDTSGLPELEQLLKHKTFTRSEIDRLTGLLKSRAIDLPVKDDRHGFESNPTDQDSGRHQVIQTTSIINKSESSGPHRSFLDNAVTTGEQNIQHLEDQIASPAQLAKAYMSSRPAKVPPPSTLGSPAQITWEDSVPPSNSPYTTKSRLSHIPMKTGGYSGVPENGFTTPRSQGRSAIYNMARTPYSRFLPATHQKVSGSKYSGDSIPSLLTSRPALENGGQTASKPMALKRRSTVLDDDIGSIGPIRRIRQKHNLLPHRKSGTMYGNGLGSDFTNATKHPFNADTRGGSTSSASYGHVPRVSSEMAAKILEHLEKMTPKEKSVESKLAAAREGSPFKLSPHMLHGQALKSMEDLDASKFLRNSHADSKSLDHSVSRLPNSHEFTTQKQVSVEEQGPVKSVHPEDKLTPDRIDQGNDNSSLEYSALPSFSSQPLEKKRPFKMSAHEDWIEMDDDCRDEHEPESAGNGLKEPLRDGKSALNEDKTLGKSPVSLEITPTTSLFSRTELEGGNVKDGEKNTGFNFTTSFAPDTRSRKVFSQSTEGDSPLRFSSGTATTRNNPTSEESKLETSSSLKNVFSGTTNAVVEVTESDTGNKKNPELDNTVNGILEKPPSIASNPMATNNSTSVDARPSNLASNDGPLTSSACLSFSSSAPASVTLANQSFTTSLSNMASSAGATTSTSALSDSVLVPSNGASSSFSASDNSFSKKLFSPPSKIEKVNGLGNFSNSSTISTFSGTSNGSSNFGGVISSSSAAKSQWPSSANGTSDGKESSFTGSGNGNVSQSTPVHFGSSSSANVFGLAGVTSLTSSSIFDSSAPTTKSEGTTQSSASASNLFKFGGGAPTTKSEGTTQSSASASASNPFIFGGGAPTTKSEGTTLSSASASASNPFKFGGGASAAVDGNAFTSTTTSSLGEFKFGASSATPTSSSSSPSFSLFNFNAGSSASPSEISTGPTSGGVFSFGAGSSSSANSVSNSTSGLFSFGAGTSVSSSSANPVTSSNTAPAIFSFGAGAPAPSSSFSSASSSSFASSLQAPVSTFGSSFSMPSSTGFSFGGSSPAFGSSNPSMVFGSTTGVTSNPAFAFSTAASAPLSSAGTQNVFGNSPSPFTTTPVNNYQMSTEDCMAEDPIQSAPAAPVFGQSLVSPQPLASPSPPGFMFGSTAPSPVAPFQFPSQQSHASQQNPSQFQASGSLEFNAGGSFSLGSGDKSGRKIVKVSRIRNRKTR